MLTYYTYKGEEREGKGERKGEKEKGKREGRGGEAKRGERRETKTGPAAWCAELSSNITKRSVGFSPGYSACNPAPC